MLIKKSRILLASSMLLSANALVAQTGTPSEPVRYIGGEIANPSVQDGALRYAVGVENRQTLRANRTHPEEADGYGWTYNHASNLAYWNGQFYQHYLSGPVDEHVAPVQTLLMTSKDGRRWNKPVVIFPPYKAPDGVKIPEGYTGYMMHQRMGFHVSKDGRLLVLGFYGHTEHPFKEGGIGRVVREVFKDGTFGPIYFIRYTSHKDWNEQNTSYPFYKKSPDAGFVAACDELLADKLKTLQWWDEDRGLDGFYSFKDATDNSKIEAPSYYHRADGKVVALWKFSYASLSDDEGKSWSKAVRVSTLLMPGGKNWGQKTKDGRYAMSFNPIATQEYRFPLIVMTSNDGIIYNNMSLVHSEVPERRFYGRWKDFGPCYVRGIVEGDGTPPSSDMWLTYTVNKEDAWVSRVPVPVRTTVEGPVNDNFDAMEVSGAVKDWNIYAPKWAPVEIAAFPSAANKSLELTDFDQYDYARAIRVFQQGAQATLAFKVLARQNSAGLLDVELNDRYGNRPVRLRFDADGALKAWNGSEEKVIAQYTAGQWYQFRLVVNASVKGSFDLYLDGRKVLAQAQLSEAVTSVERVSFRTGPYRNVPNRTTPNQKQAPPLPGADEKETPATFYIDDVQISSR
jgi:hypothetical protein